MNPKHAHSLGRLLTILAVGFAAATAVKAQDANQNTDQDAGRETSQFMAQYQRPDYRSAWDDNRGKQRQNTAGDFDYYALVLSWSPTYCSTSGDDDDQQCNRRDGKRFAFVLHGLWPQYQKGYPSSCRLPRRPYVPQPLIDSMLDIMPSSGLVIHEYRKHGTCSGLSPDGYYGLARRLFNTVSIPERYINPFETQTVSPRQLVGEFLRANPDLTPDMIAVACGGSGNRLKEIRICFAKNGRPTNCGSNEDQRRLCRAQQMFVPPVRSTARSDGGFGNSAPSAGNQKADAPLPKPRVIKMFEDE